MHNRNLRDNKEESNYSNYDCDKLPVVTIQIPVRNEPVEVLKQNIERLKRLRHPKDKLEIQIIDNSDPDKWEELSRFCLQEGISFIHREGTEGAKARNLNIGLKVAKGEIILILDADSYIPEDSIIKVIPEFLKEPKLGLIQCATKARNTDENSITKVRGLVNRAVWDLFVPFEAKYGFTMCMGHNVFIRKEAIVKSGGWPEEILSSDDVGGAIKIRNSGYKAKFVNCVIMEEGIPNTFSRCNKQWQRWSYGNTMLLCKYFKIIVNSKEMSWNEKVSLLMTLSFFPMFVPFTMVALIDQIYFGTFVILSGYFIPILPMIVLTLDEKCKGLKNLLKIFFSSIIFNIGFIPAVMSGAFLFLIGKKMGWQITSKGKQRENISKWEILRENRLSLLIGITYVSAFILFDLIQEMHLRMIGLSLAICFILAPLLFNISPNWFKKFKLIEYLQKEK